MDLTFLACSIHTVSRRGSKQLAAMVPKRVAMVVLVLLALLLSLGVGSSLTLRDELANSLDANEPDDGANELDNDGDDANDVPSSAPTAFCKGEGGKCKEVNGHGTLQELGGSENQKWACCPGLFCKKLGSWKMFQGSGRRRYLCMPTPKPTASKK